ncbi:MAG: glycosyltransferase, exosortase A system-associated [Candidatus Saccharibacteria bacterium]|nr:glycosyltransferase, exosortase A system-associated [Rhodoferax sp.]
MSLRILHVLDHSTPLHSGYTFRTLSILREQHRLGWETIHLTSPKQGPTAELQEEVEGLTFYRTPSLAGVSLVSQMCLTARRLSEVVRLTKPQLIHVHSPVLNALPSLWVARRQRLPLVYEMRASWEDAAVDHGTTQEGSIRYRISRAMETFALRQADQVTTICEGLRNDITQRGIARERVTVIPNAVDPGLFSLGGDADPDLRRSLGLDGTIVIGFIGSFYGYEGLSLLVDATQRLLPRYPYLRVLLVGGGPQDSSLKAQVAAAGLQDRVIFTGRVAHAEVQRYYELIDVLAYPRLPTRLTELVTPLKPLEAMAQGRMLVASDVGGHNELIRHGETGFLFQAGDAGALAQAIDDVIIQRTLWPQIRTQARRFVERERTWTASVRRYRAVYQQAMSVRGHSQMIST